MLLLLTDWSRTAHTEKKQSTHTLGYGSDVFPALSEAIRAEVPPNTSHTRQHFRLLANALMPP
jgi:hypothetical protein